MQYFSREENIANLIHIILLSNYYIHRDNIAILNNLLNLLNRASRYRIFSIYMQIPSTKIHTIIN